MVAYYRNEVIEVLLESGIALHVFGDTWKESPMFWHKDGFTERIANAMLQKSVAVTDRTTYLEENGYRKAIKQHTWRHRAEKILEFIEEDRELSSRF